MSSNTLASLFEWLLLAQKAGLIDKWYIASDSPKDETRAEWRVGVTMSGQSFKTTCPLTTLLSQDCASSGELLANNVESLRRFLETRFAENRDVGERAEGRDSKLIQEIDQ